MSTSEKVLYTITGFAIDSGEPWTFCDTFDDKAAAIEAALKMNNAKKPIVRDCMAVLAWPEHVEWSERQRRLCFNAELAETD
jgi:hypothetical protein